MINKTVLTFCILILLNSCKITNDVATNHLIQKRKYNKGWHFIKKKVDIGGTNLKLSNNDSNLAIMVLEKEKQQIFIEVEEEQSKFNNSINRNYKKVKYDYFDNSQMNYENECDIIFMKNGDEIEAKVLDITPKVIKYKMCSNMNGPTITVNSSDVFKIKYPNGTSTMVSKIETNSSTNKTNQSDENKSSVWGGLGLLMAIIGLMVALFTGGWIFPIIFGISAFIYGIIGLTLENKKSKNKKSKTGLSLSILSLIFGVFSLSLGILIIL